MARTPNWNLSRRERQIMSVVFRMGHASVGDIAAAIPDPPTHTAIRTHLRILQRKGQVRRKRVGRRHLYRPSVSRRRAARAAMDDLLNTFFDDSLSNAVAAHLSDPAKPIDRDELERIRRLIDRARETEA